ncbi:hypothetical protein [Streptomyces sp. NBC_01314]|uniref:hypothetical protein n=1 Tax=Streptomyces sp. NBC_01314 TaxID=2903821 RepID=UPI003086CD68|nr:hypothetical protein OG622_46715 [Streptomyces sp. NBC_01314]
MTAPSTAAPGSRPDERQFLPARTSDPEQRVIASVISRLASWRRADRAHPWARRSCRSRSGHRRPSPAVPCAAVSAQQLVIRDDDRRNPWDRMHAQVWPGP